MSRFRYRFESALEFFLNREVTVETVAGSVRGRLASSDEGGRLAVLTAFGPVVVNHWTLIWR